MTRLINAFLIAGFIALVVSYGTGVVIMEVLIG